MKKIVFLLLLLIIFTGCEANYNLTIEDDRIIESSDFILEKSDENERQLNDFYKTKYLAHFDMDKLKDYDYKKKLIDDDKHIGMNLSYIYTGTSYQNSSMLNRCFYKKSLIKTDDNIILYTEGGASCFYKDESKLLDSLNVNIKTDFDVLENNADTVKDNVYTWKFTEDNFSTKDVFIKIKKSNKFNFIPLIFMLILIIILIIVFVIIKRKNTRINKL